MASLHLPPALAAAAHSDIETAYYGSPDNLFLILCCAAFRLHAATAMRAALRQWNRDPFIHPRRNGAARLSAIAPARLAPWPLRVDFRIAARMWRRLTLAGTQRCFQFPAQPFGFLLEALGFPLKPIILPPELLVLLLRPFQLSPGDKVDGFSWFVTRRPPNWSHPPYGSRKGGFCPAKTSGSRIQDVLRLVNKYAGVQRQLFDALALERISQSGIRGLQCFLTAGHCDALRHFSQL
jgi:hypothetical protein